MLEKESKGRNRIVKFAYFEENFSQEIQKACIYILDNKRPKFSCLNTDYPEFKYEIQ